jgi:hypothetical protein
MNGMDEPTILSTAQILCDRYRDIVVFDPAIKIDWRTENMGSAFEINKGASPLCWEVTVSPQYHKEASEVRITVIEVIANILTNEMEFLEQSLVVTEVRKRIECKIFLTLERLLPDLEQLAAAMDEET